MVNRFVNSWKIILLMLMRIFTTNLGEFLDKFPEEEQEETEVTKKEIEDTVAAAVAKALEAQQIGRASCRERVCKQV